MAITPSEYFELKNQYERNINLQNKPYTIGDVYKAGIGDLEASLGGILRWGGLETIGNKIIEKAEDKQLQVSPYSKPVTWRSVFDKDFWGKGIVRSLPFLIASIPLAVAGGAVAGAAAGAAGLSPLFATIIKALGGAAFSRAVQGAVSAGGTYNEAVSRGMQKKDADRIANDVFSNNLGLVGMDAAQFLVAFAPIPEPLKAFASTPVGKVATTAGRLAFTAGTEAMEEGIQTAVEKKALGDPIVFDDEMKMSMMMGGVMGGTLGLAGVALDGIKTKIDSKVSPEVAQSFNAHVKSLESSGMSHEQAIDVVYSKLAESPKGQEIIANASLEFQQEFNIPQEISAPQEMNIPQDINIPQDMNIQQDINIPQDFNAGQERTFYDKTFKGDEGYTRPSNPDVSEILNTSAKPRNLHERIQQSLKNIKKNYEKLFVYEADVQKYPKMVEMLRRFQGTTRDAQMWALKNLKEVTGSLESPDAYNVFRQLVFLEDYEASLLNGESIPLPKSGNKLSLDDIQIAKAELMQSATPGVMQAIESHTKLYQDMWNLLASEGKVKASEGRSSYVPHKVIDYIYENEARREIGARKLKETNRYYLKERGMSNLPIETDYIGVTLDYLSKVYMDMQVDAFTKQVVQNFDATHLLEGVKPTPDTLYEIEGSKFVGFDLEKINRRSSGPESLLDALVEGEQQPNVVLLPQEISHRLHRLYEPTQSSVIFDGMRKALRIQKDFIFSPLGVGIPWQIGNLFGDLYNLYLNDIEAFKYIPEAFKTAKEIVTGADVSPENANLARVAREGRVVESALYTRGGSIVDPELTSLEPQKYAARRFNLLAPLNESWRQLGEIRELTPRLAKLAADLDRISKGDMPESKHFSPAQLYGHGMTLEEMATKTAREFTVDYSKLTPEGRGVIRDLLFPFFTFYQQNSSNFLNYIRRNPKEAFVKIGVPMVVMTMWNNMVFPEQEKELPDYYKVMPHIITGFKTKDGKPIILAMQTPADLAAKMVGLDIAPDLIGGLLTGEYTGGEAIEKFIKNFAPSKDTLMMPKPLWEQFNPLIKAPIEAYAMNKNTFMDSPIVPYNELGTPEDAKKRFNYVLGQMIAPIGGYMRTTRTSDEGSNISEWLLKGPLNIKKGLGVREVNIESSMTNKLYDLLEKEESKSRKWSLKNGSAYPDAAKLRYLRQVTSQITALRKMEKQTQDEDKKEAIRNHVLATLRFAQETVTRKWGGTL